MSRRARRRRGGSTKKGGWWLKLLLAGGVLALVVMLGGWFWLKSWLHSADFRTMLEKEVGGKLDADVRFGDFHWDGTEVRTSSFDARGHREVRSILADRLSLDIGLDRVRERTVEIRDARIGRIEIEIDPNAAAKVPEKREPLPEIAPTPDKPHWYDGFVPNQVELTGLKIGESVVRVSLPEGPLSFEGTAWEVIPGAGGRGYETVGTGGVIRFPWTFVPELRMDRVRLSYRDDTVFLTDATFGAYDRGTLSLNGEAGVGSGEFSFNGRLTGIRADEVLPEDWKQRLEGRVEAEFGVTDGPHGPVVEGHVDLLDGTLTGLPVLDALGAYGGNRRFLRLTLSEAATDFLWEDGNLKLTNFVLASEGLMRVEGRLTKDRSDRLDGEFRVGLTPGTLALIPGAETKVFLPGPRGLLWTTVRITGTADDPEEDLTERLILAAGMRMFEILPETGERVLRFSQEGVNPELMREVLGENGLIERGEDLIDRGKGLLDGEGDVIDEASDVLLEGAGLIDLGRDIFGGGRRREPAPEPEKTPREPE